MSATLDRDQALREELRFTVRMLQFGLQELRGQDGADSFCHPFMLTLASGFERLMKAIVCLHTRRTGGAYPDRSIFPAGHKGHNLELLLDRITDECFSPSQIRMWPGARTDVAVLRTNRKLRRLVQVLSRYGEAARYHHLDIVLGEEPKTDSPEQEWAVLQVGIARETLAASPGDPLHAVKLPEGQERINQIIAMRLQTLARSLARLVVLISTDDQRAAHEEILTPLLSSPDGADDSPHGRRVPDLPPGDEK